MDSVTGDTRGGLYADSTSIGEKLTLQDREGYKFHEKVRRQEGQSTNERVGL